MDAKSSKNKANKIGGSKKRAESLFFFSGIRSRITESQPIFRVCCGCFHSWPPGAARRLLKANKRSKKGGTQGMESAIFKAETKGSRSIWLQDNSIFSQTARQSMFSNN